MSAASSASAAAAAGSGTGGACDSWGLAVAAAALVGGGRCAVELVAFEPGPVGVPELPAPPPIVPRTPAKPFPPLNRTSPAAGGVVTPPSAPAGDTPGPNPLCAYGLFAARVPNGVVESQGMADRAVGDHVGEGGGRGDGDRVVTAVSSSASSSFGGS